MKGQGNWMRAVRRGVALGLACTALWAATLTTQPEKLEQAVRRLAGRADVTVPLLAAAMGHTLPAPERALEGWGRLVLEQSSLLRQGERAVLQLRREQGQLPEDGPADSDDQTQPQLQPQGEQEGVVEMTGRGKTGGQYLFWEGLYLYNRSGLELEGSVLAEGQVKVKLGEGPHILIVHSHGSEAYWQTEEDPYVESDPYRTTDCRHNVVRVGEEMAQVFRAHGFQVIHDTTLFDYPSYSEAYGRSQAAVEQWLEQYPTIQVVLDVHRDALVDSEGRVYRLVTEEAGEKMAQVMLVLGSNASADHPGWKDNLAFAAALQRQVVRGYDSLARPMVLRSGRYNQQLLPGSVLVEVGGHGNTLQQAIAGARQWADSAARTLQGMR